MIDVDLIYKALANGFRRQVLMWLKEPDDFFAPGHIDFRHGVPPNVIHARSGLAQSTVSAHLTTLSEAGLLVSYRVGQWVLLSRNEKAIRAFVRQVQSEL